MIITMLFIDSNIYWTERGSSSVKRLDRRDSVVRFLPVSGQTSAIALTVPSRHLLYATGQSVTLRRFPPISSGISIHLYIKTVN